MIQVVKRDVSRELTQEAAFLAGFEGVLKLFKTEELFESKVVRFRGFVCEDKTGLDGSKSRVVRFRFTAEYRRYREDGREKHRVEVSFQKNSERHLHVTKFEELSGAPGGCEFQMLRFLNGIPMGIQTGSRPALL